MHIIELINLLFLASITGAWMMGAILLGNSQKRLSASAYIEVEQSDKTIGRIYFPILFACTVITQVIFLATHGTHPVHSFWLSVASLILVVLSAGMTAKKVLPLNRLFMSWSPSAPPSNWHIMRDKWQRYHRIRTVIIVIAFTLQASAVIWH